MLVCCLYISGSRVLLTISSARMKNKLSVGLVVVFISRENNCIHWVNKRTFTTSWWVSFSAHFAYICFLVFLGKYDVNSSGKVKIMTVLRRLVVVGKVWFRSCITLRVYASKLRYVIIDTLCNCYDISVLLHVGNKIQKRASW